MGESRYSEAAPARAEGAAAAVAGAPRAAAVVALASLAGVCAVLLYLVGRPLATDDLWWHLKLGEIYAQAGPWLAEDPLYHTTRGRPTVPHEWLFQVALHQLQRGVGFQGLRVAHVLAVTALLCWVWRVFRRASPGAVPAALATLALAVLSWYRLFQLRPDLASLAAVLALYVLLCEPARAPSWGRVAAAVALLCAWANVHSLVAIGPALLLAASLGLLLEWALLSLVRSTPRADRAATRGHAQRLAAALALSLLFTAVNPRGFEQHVTFFVESASGDIWHLQDDFLPWNPLWPPHDRRALTPFCWLVADLLLLAFALSAGAAGVRVLRERSAAAVRALDALHLGLGAAGLVAMLVAARFHWLALFPLLYVLRAATRAVSGSRVRERRLAFGAAAACLLLALAFPRGIRLDSYVAEVAAESGGYWQSPWLDQRYCGAGTRFLADAGLEGRMFHPFNLGGFLAYWLAPDLRTFIDGRMDHYPSKVLDDYLRIRHASQAGAARLLQQLLDDWDVDVFFGTSFPESRYADGQWIEHLRRLHGWVPVFASQTHSVFLRRTPSNARNFALVKAYYLERKLPFDVAQGFDAGRAIRRRPAWAVNHGLVPAHFERLERERTGADPRARAAALAELGQIYWQVGAFAEQVAADRELLTSNPRPPIARRRLADGLLQLDRPGEALEAVRSHLADHPDDERAIVIHSIAQQRLRASRETPPSPPAPSRGQR
jgi:hypothetical protein